MPTQDDTVVLLHADRILTACQFAVDDCKIDEALRRNGGRCGQQQEGECRELTPHRDGVAATSAMRLTVQPESLGAGSAAGSPSADHIRRPKLSVKPATGFQAAV